MITNHAQSKQRWHTEMLVSGVYVFHSLRIARLNASGLNNFFPVQLLFCHIIAYLKGIVLTKFLYIDKMKS